MAQHFRVTNELPEEIKKSIQRIAIYIARSPWLHQPEVKEVLVYTKHIFVLPEEYRMNPRDKFIFNVKSYHANPANLLAKKENCTFEVHADEKGDIVEIYFPY